MYKTSYRPLSRMEIVESIIADQGAVLDHMTPRQASAEIRKKAKQHEESQRSEWNTLQSFNCELPLIPQSLVLTSKVLFVQSSIPAVVMHGYRNIPGRPPAC